MVNKVLLLFALGVHMNTKKKTIIGISAITILIVLALVGSRLFSKKVKNPYEIMVNGNVLSLYDNSKEDFEENGFDVYGSSDDDPFYIAYDADYSNWNNYVEYRDWGSDVNEIGCVYIFDDSVVTYNSISVGDDIDKLKKNFDKLYIQNDDDCHTSDVYGYLRYCAIAFNSKGEEVLSLKELDENEKGTFIMYHIDKNNKIVNIIFHDAKMAKVGI